MPLSNFCACYTQVLPLRDDSSILPSEREVNSVLPVNEHYLCPYSICAYAVGEASNLLLRNGHYLCPWTIYLLFVQGAFCTGDNDRSLNATENEARGHR